VNNAFWPKRIYRFNENANLSSLRLMLITYKKDDCSHFDSEAFQLSPELTRQRA
jgi:hypothetical protein